VTSRNAQRPRPPQALTAGTQRCSAERRPYHHAGEREWCAVEPRTAYPRLPPQRIALAARGEDPGDTTVWALTCFATRAES
jgi:hypothetical protein